MPLWVSSHHVHKENTCKHDSHSHFQKTAEPCLVCNFEFSVFSDIEIFPQSQKLQYTEAIIQYKPTYVASIPVQYSFQHRAPPVFTN